MNSETVLKADFGEVRLQQQGHIDPNWIMIIGGGVGDTLQCLPYMLANRSKPPRYFVSTHTINLMDLFNAVDIPIEKLAIFTNPADGNKIMVEFAEHGQLCYCPRTYYFSFNPFRIPDRLFKRQGTTIGLHIGASKFSIGLHAYQGLPVRELPVKLVDELVTDSFDYLLFGSRDELNQLAIKETDNLRFVCCDSIADSLSYVCHCDALVASDSAIKTMANMLRIPTIVWMGAHNDSPRDKNFIDPYLRAGLLTCFRYGKLDDAEFKQGLQFTKQMLALVLNK